MPFRLPLHIGIPMQSRHEIASSALALARRHLIIRDEEDDDAYEWFWYTKTGIIVKYVLFFAFLFILAAWVIGGRMHAKRRMRRGLKPMGYHAWLLSRTERMQADPSYGYPPHAHATPIYRPLYPQQQAGADYYGMHPMPPPVYDPSRPPVYDGPPAGSKVDPMQDRHAPTQGQGQNQMHGGGEDTEYAPPAGPPPGAFATRG
ncbi:hypothetical protein F4777DRAFT_568227 [Nemania sp. FL0916]|nr:hypothetical protein F4777DRAFT_568227 [Nemania sp. FL0916]